MRDIAFRAYDSVIGTVTMIKHHPVDRNAVDIDIGAPSRASDRTRTGSVCVEGRSADH